MRSPSMEAYHLFRGSDYGYAYIDAIQIGSVYFAAKTAAAKGLIEMK